MRGAPSPGFGMTRGGASGVVSQLSFAVVLVVGCGYLEVFHENDSSKRQPCVLIMHHARLACMYAETDEAPHHIPPQCG